MSIQKLDIWNQWSLQISIIISGDKLQIYDSYIYVYAHDENGLAAGLKNKIYQNHGGTPAQAGYSIADDYLINILNTVVTNEGIGLKFFSTGTGDFEVSADELRTIATPIAQLNAIFYYKTQQTDLKQFAFDLKDQTVYYSTLVGENDEGKTLFFACKSEDDQNQYYPVFLTEEHLKEFFQQYKRSAFIILKDTLQHFLTVLDTNDKLSQLGVIIEPSYSCCEWLPPKFRIK